MIFGRHIYKVKTEFKGKNEVSTVSLPLLFAVTLSIITSNIYTRLAACNCISITFWSGDLPSPLMAIFNECLQPNLHPMNTIDKIFLSG